MHAWKSAVTATDGSMFQTLAAATGKARSTMVLCNDRGTCNNASHKIMQVFFILVRTANKLIRLLSETIIKEWALTTHRWSACLRQTHNGRTAVCWWLSIPLPEKCTLSSYDLDLWLLTLKTFSVMPTRMKTVCVKFHWNLSSNWRETASREIGVNGRTDGQKDDPTS